MVGQGRCHHTIFRRHRLFLRCLLPLAAGAVVVADQLAISGLIVENVGLPIVQGLEGITGYLSSGVHAAGLLGMLSAGVLF